MNSGWWCIFVHVKLNLRLKRLRVRTKSKPVREKKFPTVKSRNVKVRRACFLCEISQKSDIFNINLSFIAAESLKSCTLTSPTTLLDFLSHLRAADCSQSVSRRNTVKEMLLMKRQVSHRPNTRRHIELTSPHGLGLLMRNRQRTPAVCLVKKYVRIVTVSFVFRGQTVHLV